MSDERLFPENFLVYEKPAVSKYAGVRKPQELESGGEERQKKTRRR
jgi:hypothetical protein